MSKRRHYRSIWISDVHLGMHACQAELLVDFLKHTKSDYFYLVGDIIDLWEMRRDFYWKESHTHVLQHFLKRARKTKETYYVIGNHDEFFRGMLDIYFDKVKLVDEVVHTTADGKCMLVTHGDKYDVIVMRYKWLAKLGSAAYDSLLWMNTHFNRIRRWMKLPYWSLSAAIKHKVKKAVEFIGNFEHALAKEAKKRGMDGVICGHIHHAEIKDIDDVLYCNDGDWVESCTALVEHEDGRLEIIDWIKESRMDKHEL